MSNSWGISFHEEIGPLFSRGIQFFTRTSWGFMKILKRTSWGFCTRNQFSAGLHELAHDVLKKASWGPHEKLGQFPRTRWLLMRKLMSAHEYTHEDQKFSKKTINELLFHTQTCHLFLVKLSWTQFLSYESLHEEQTEQQMRKLHHKYMYGWNKIKELKKTQKKTGNRKFSDLKFQWKSE